MLPLLVGGAEQSRTARFLFSPLFAEFQDQLPKLSTGGRLPLAKWGGGGVVGRECGWEEDCKE